MLPAVNPFATSNCARQRDEAPAVLLQPAAPGIAWTTGEVLAWSALPRLLAAAAVLGPLWWLVGWASSHVAA